MNVLSRLRLAGMASAVVLASQGTVRAQEFDRPDQLGWYVRLDAVARFNIKASISVLPPAVGGPGYYNDGFVLPDSGGTASGKTWNWGYSSASQIVGDQLVLQRLDGLPTIGTQNANVSNPTLGGEIIAGYDFPEFEIGKKTARLGFEIGYGYSFFSEGLNFAAAATATRTTDGYGLGGIVPPIPPYAGTAAGPGPLIDLAYSSHAVVVSPAATAFQSKLDTSLHNLRIGPVLEIDLNKHLSVAFGAGYSSVYADARLNYLESVTFSNPAMPALTPARASIRMARWRPGAYADLRLNYQFTQRLGAFIGGDFQFNKKLTFGDAGHQVKLDFGTTYGAKAGVAFRF